MRGKMKKIIVLAAASFLLGACGTMNKNTVSYQMSKIDASKYYVVAGDGANKKASAQKALDNMK